MPFEKHTGRPNADARYYEKKMLWGLLVSIALLKIGLLLWFAPLYTNDSAGYIAFAERISSSPRLLRSIDLKSHYIQITTLRTIGVPALIALCKAATAYYWDYLFCFLQIAASLYASYVFFYFCRFMGMTAGWAGFAVFTQATSFNLVLDQSILTDSLHISLFTIFACTVLRLLFCRNAQKISGGSFFKAGLLLVPCFLIRDTTQLNVLSIVVLLGACLIRTGARPRCSALVLLLLPVTITYCVYGSWNYYRSGDFFITTACQTSLLQPIMHIAAENPAVLEGADPLSVTARQFIGTNILTAMWSINKDLHNRYGYTPLEIDALNRKKIISICLKYPRAFFRRYCTELLSAWVMFFAPLRPFEAIKEIAERQDPLASWPHLRGLLARSVRSWHPGAVLFVTLVQTSRLIACIITLFFFFAIPLKHALSRRTNHQRIHDAMDMLCPMWIFFWSYVILFAFGHIEMRYLQAYFSISISVGIFMLMRLWNVSTLRQQNTQTARPV